MEEEWEDFKTKTAHKVLGHELNDGRRKDSTFGMKYLNMQ